MATRKLRMNTESPTPSSGSESMPSTPTTLPTRTRGRKSKIETGPETAITIKTEKPDVEDEEAVKPPPEDEEQMETKDIVADARKESPKEPAKEVPTSARKRRLAAVKDEPVAEKTGEKVAGLTPPATEKTDSGTPGEVVSPTGMAKRPRRSVVENCLANKPAAKISKRRNSTGKIEKPGRKLSSRIKKLKQMRKAKLKRPLLKKPISKPLKAALLNEKPEPKPEYKQTKKAKVEKNVDSASDSELLKVSRRRSDSVSKCSDMTDTSSFQETKDTEELVSAVEASTPKVEVKEETKVEEAKIATKDIKTEDVVTAPVALAAPVGGLNDSGIGGDSDNSQSTKTKDAEPASAEQKRPLRRPRRNAIHTLLPPKTMSTRSRSETPNKIDTTPKSTGITETTVSTESLEIIGAPELADDEVEEEEVDSAPSEEKMDSMSTPLHIETTPTKKLSTTSSVRDMPVDEKSESLSPVLVSEGLSEISVKQFYGRADFLENNLGIEEDPKLGEIVQVKEKIKQDPEEGENGNVINNNSTKEDEKVIKGKKDENKDTHNVKEIEIEKEGERKVPTPSLSDNLIVLGGEIEVRPKDNKKLGQNKIIDEGNVGEVVLFTITNGVRANPENLETVLENQKLKERDEDVEIINDKEPKSEPLVEKLKCENVEIEEPQANGTVPASTDLIKETPVKEKLSVKTKSTVPQRDVETDAKPTPTTEESMEIEAIVIETDEDLSSNSNLDVNKENINTSENEEQKVEPRGRHARNKSSTAAPVEPRVSESLEVLKQKESHLKNLGLLTHQAAVAATIEKQKRREQLKTTAVASSSTANNGKGKKNAEYTGTLKTVIKLHRNTNDKKKGRMPLKMTLHKGRGKNGNTADRGDASSAANSEEDTYYTIHNEMDNDTTHGGHSRKTHYRSYNIDGSAAAATEPNDTTVVKEVEKALVIPEKASSFRYHPGKLCQDQCFYCGGKFGLFDTPCHVAQIKSMERQKKILENEEKLTVDNCLCDACFRHVDRRANCPSYKKRLSAPATLSEVSGEDPSGQQNGTVATEAALFQQNKEPSWCKVVDCKELATHSVRRKWALKMRKTISKMIQINFEHTTTTAFLPICDKHYDDISHLMVCALCNRRLMRNHIYYINQDSSKLEQLLSSQGIPVLIGPTPVVCKLCRYYANLLLKPQEGKKGLFVKNYRRRLLEYHNVELVEDDGEEDEAKNAENADNQQQQTSRRGRVPKRGRKSTPDISTPSSANSDDVQMRPTRSTSQVPMDTDVTINYDSSTGEPGGPIRSERQRLKQKQQLEQLLAEQQRLLQEQMKTRLQEVRQHHTKTSSEDISLLRTNPNISMRELFPGEEEMGLHVNVPFGSANSWRTPEGWTKISTTVQYDEPTRRLWEELQRPYGNQSSFLRHLILLEKYFRNGDLVLAPNANSNAATYSDSVQNRLRSYDNRGSGGASVSPLAQLMANPATTITNVSVPKALNASVTVIPTGKKSLPASTSISKQTIGTDSNSLLKSNVGSQRSSTSYTITTEPIVLDSSNKQSQPTNKTTRGGADEVSKTNSNSTNAPKTNKSSIGMPPELISINNSSTDGNSNSSKQSQQQFLSQQLYLAQMQLTLQQHLQQQHQSSLLLLQPQNHTQSLTPKKMTGHGPPAKINTSLANNQVSNGKNASTSSSMNPQNMASTSNSSNIIRLPDTLTDAERHESKPWKPTLIPLSAAKNLCEKELYQAADGRKLPKLVKVQSGGKPYMISIHDYNRMCILRRESLLSGQASGSKAQTSNTVTATVTSASLAAAISAMTPASTTVEVEKVIPAKAPVTILNVPNTNKKVQIPNKILEQNSLIPLGPSGGNDSLLKFRKNPTSLLKANAPMVTNSNSPGQVAMGGGGAKIPTALASALSQTNVVSITSTPSISAILAMNSESTTPITITSVNSVGSPSVVSGGTSALQELFKTTQQVTPQQSMWQWAESLNKNHGGVIGISAIDNSATSILSKIPKSLTVIPQKRLSNKGTDEI